MATKMMKMQKIKNVTKGQTRTVSQISNNSKTKTGIEINLKRSFLFQIFIKTHSNAIEIVLFFQNMCSFVVKACKKHCDMIPFS